MKNEYNAKSLGTLKLKTDYATQNIFITFVQRRPTVFDVGPRLFVQML